MYIEGDPVLHIFNDVTNSSAAQFVEPLTIQSAWETILRLWKTVYIGLPNALVFDDRSQFRDTFVAIC